MTPGKRKARDGGNRADFKAPIHSHYKQIPSVIKRLIVLLALWLIIPSSLAGWLIRKLGLCHA